MIDDERISIQLEHLLDRVAEVEKSLKDSDDIQIESINIYKSPKTAMQWAAEVQFEFDYTHVHQPD